MALCTYLFNAAGENATALCTTGAGKTTGNPMAIPEGEDDPRKAHYDDPKVRLGEFDGGLKAPVALWLLVEDDPYYLAEGPGSEFWEDKEPRGLQLVYATRGHGKKKLQSIYDCHGYVEDLPEPWIETVGVAEREASIKKLFKNSGLSKLDPKSAQGKALIASNHHRIPAIKRKRNPERAPAVKGHQRAIEEMAISYGCSAPIWDVYCNDDDFDAAIAEILTQAQPLLMLPGFYLDRRMNRIGSTGWEFLVGDLDSAMDRMREEL